MHLSRRISTWLVRNVANNGTSNCCLGYWIIIQVTMQALVANQQEYSKDEIHSTSWIISLILIQTSRSRPQPNLKKKSKTGPTPWLTKRNKISCNRTLNTRNIMNTKRKQLHSQETITVSYYNKKRIIKHRKSFSEITVGWGHLWYRNFYLKKTI